MPDNKPPIGAVTWRDLTVPNADEVRDFYKEVAGWTSEPVSMGDYNDYNMKSPETNETIAGICHKKGTNEKLPLQWLMYITIADIDKSLDNCLKLGGKIIDGPKKMGESRYAIIQDPAGAVCALFQH